MGTKRQLLMPKLGLTMTEGVVAEWPLAEGARFSKDDIYLVVETDKVANDLRAPEAGRLLRILVPKGTTVPVGTPLAEWEIEEGDVIARRLCGLETAPPSRWRAATTFELTAGRRLTESKQQVPHFYLATEIEVSQLQTLRRQRNAAARGPRITLTHLVVSAVARSLARHPEVNRVWKDDGFVEFERADVGIAVHTDQGPVVVVLHGADSLSLDALALEMGALVDRARSMALTSQDVEGGAISVSNAGMHNVTWMGSIISPGQSAILSVGAERKIYRPGADGAPRLACELGVVLSCDHRVLDGVRGVAYLNDVRTTLERPEVLFESKWCNRACC